MKAMLRGQRNTALAAIVVGLALLPAHLAVAQAPSGPLAPRPGQTAQTAPKQTPQKPPDQAIRVRVNLVDAPVVVRNTRGELVLDLVEQNFHIFDNGVEQKLEAFDMGGAPLSVVVVMETSSRIEPLLPALRRTGVLFT
jgi:hypothetical protein